MVAAIKAYVADQTGYNLTAVQTALANWKQRDPKEYFNRGRLLQEVLEAEIAEHGTRVWGTGAIPMVDHTCHPAYEPQKWRGLIETSTNCYAYACDDPFGHRAGDKPQPGEGGGYWAGFGPTRPTRISRNSKAATCATPSCWTTWPATIRDSPGWCR